MVLSGEGSGRIANPSALAEEVSEDEATVKMVNGKCHTHNLDLKTGEDLKPGKNQVSSTSSNGNLKHTHIFNGFEGCTVGCLGAGHVGGTTMAVFAQRCPKNEFLVFDNNPEKVAQWNSPTLPFHEPFLDDLVFEQRRKNLRFVALNESSYHLIDACDILFVAVGTPLKFYGVGALSAVDMSYWQQAANLIAKYSFKPKIIVEKSTVPVKTASELSTIIRVQNPSLAFCVLSNPEFLAEGSAVKDLLSPDRVLIGGSLDCEITQSAVEVLCSLYENWIAKSKILTTDVWSAELAKLASNALLAQRISSINSFSEICEAVGADVSQISKAAGSDRRIGANYLRASVGFGGSCLKKDLSSLTYLCRSLNMNESAEYWAAVLKMNENQKTRFAKKVLQVMFNTLKNKTLAIFGFSFKSKTSDVREAPSIDVSKMLLNEGATLNIWDPQARKPDILAELELAVCEKSQMNNLSISYSPEKAVEGAEAIVVLTDWDAFLTYDYSLFYTLMKKPTYIFDGQNFLDHNRLFEIGFEVHSIGKPPLRH